jgi:putative ABC transport system ATP-binding protein
MTAITSDRMIELAGVTKTYGHAATGTQALAGLDLCIARGEFVSLMGPSGSGKTTLLNISAGLDVPDSGRVVVCGRELSTLRDHELATMRLHTIGFVFQAFNLIPALTVEENIAWPLEYSGCSRSETRQRVAGALERLGVVGRERRYPGELAGGEQQRVAIARAIATRPALLLADEPTGNLDSHTGRVILDFLRELNQRDGMTVLMVTHNVFAAGYGDRTLELHDGRIVRDVRTPAREREPLKAEAME